MSNYHLSNGMSCVSFRRGGSNEDLGPLFVVREFDLKIIRSSPKYRKSTGTSEQAIRASIRQAILNMNLNSVEATKSEIRVLKSAGILGKRAPSCSLLSANDMCKLLKAFGKQQCAEQLKVALKQQNPGNTNINNIQPPYFSDNDDLDEHDDLDNSNTNAQTATIPFRAKVVKSRKLKTTANVIKAKTPIVNATVINSNIDSMSDESDDSDSSDDSTSFTASLKHMKKANNNNANNSIQNAYPAIIATSIGNAVKVSTSTINNPINNNNPDPSAYTQANILLTASSKHPRSRFITKLTTGTPLTVTNTDDYEYDLPSSKKQKTVTPIQTNNNTLVTDINSLFGANSPSSGLDALLHAVETTKTNNNNTNNNAATNAIVTASIVSPPSHLRTNMLVGHQSNASVVNAIPVNNTPIPAIANPLTINITTTNGNSIPMSSPVTPVSSNFTNLNVNTSIINSCLSAVQSANALISSIKSSSSPITPNFSTAALTPNNPTPISSNPLQSSTTMVN